MATLLLTKAFVNLLATGASVAAQSQGRSLTTGMDGEIRKYAGGRTRAVTEEGVRIAYDITLLHLNATQVATLRSWIGQEVLVRDNFGRAVKGVFWSVPEVEPGRHLNDGLHVKLSVQGVTVVDGL